MSLEISKSLTHRSGLEGSVESTLLSSCFASCSRGYLKRCHKGCNLEKKLTTSSLRRCISLLLTLCCQTVGLHWHQKGPSWAGRGLGTGQQVTGALWGLWGGRKASASGGSEVLQLLGHNVQLWVPRSAQALQKMHKVVWVVGKKITPSPSWLQPLHNKAARELLWEQLGFYAAGSTSSPSWDTTIKWQIIWKMKSSLWESTCSTWAACP